MNRYCAMLQTIGTAFLEVPIAQVFMETAAFGNKLMQMFQILIDKKPLKIIDARGPQETTVAIFNIPH